MVELERISGHVDGTVLRIDAAIARGADFICHGQSASSVQPAGKLLTLNRARIRQRVIRWSCTLRPTRPAVRKRACGTATPQASFGRRALPADDQTRAAHRIEQRVARCLPLVAAGEALVAKGLAAARRAGVDAPHDQGGDITFTARCFERSGIDAIRAFGTFLELHMNLPGTRRRPPHTSLSASNAGLTIHRKGDTRKGEAFSRMPGHGAAAAAPCAGAPRRDFRLLAAHR
ncbi:MAG TPA: hypothetical protein PKC97_13275 [Burkholderiaceae bacterium]|nr:hypothetical protein [Burkholderiaceae bacterium]